MKRLGLDADSFFLSMEIDNKIVSKSLASLKRQLSLALNYEETQVALLNTFVETLKLIFQNT